MPTILADGTTETASSTFTLAQGETTTIILTTTTGGDVPASASAVVQIQSVGGQWMNVGPVTGAAKLLTGPGTFRVLRGGSARAFGIDRI